MTKALEQEQLLTAFVAKLNESKQNNPLGLSRRDIMFFRSVMSLVAFVSLYLMSTSVTLSSRLSVLETKDNVKLEQYLTVKQYEKDRALFLPVNSYIKIETERALDIANMLLDFSLILKIREEDIKLIRSNTIRDLNKSLFLGTYSIPRLKQ